MRIGSIGVLAFAASLGVGSGLWEVFEQLTGNNKRSSQHAAQTAFEGKLIAVSLAPLAWIGNDLQQATR